MREILFKAKRKDNGEWVKGLIWKKKFNTSKIFISCFPDEDDNEEVFVVDSATICQYTGLTDNNGNKIWENDVVRYYDDLADMTKEDLIKWNETHASFTRLHKSKMGLQYLYIDECIANRCEVIGNIFDNPELLEGGASCLMKKK